MKESILNWKIKKTLSGRETSSFEENNLFAENLEFVGEKRNRTSCVADPESSKTRAYQKTPAASRRMKKGNEGRYSGPSDLESIKTEDYENRFFSLMVRKTSPSSVASPHQPSAFRPGMDAASTHGLHEKFKNAVSE